MSIATDEKFTFELKTKITKGVLDTENLRYNSGLTKPRLFVNGEKQGVIVATNGKGLAITGPETIDAGKMDIPIPVTILPTKKSNRKVSVSGDMDIWFECQNKIDSVAYSERIGYPKVNQILHDWDDNLPSVTLDAKLLLSVVEALTPIGSDTQVTIQLDGNNGIKVVHSDGGIGVVMPCNIDKIYKPGEVYEATRSIVDSYYND